jgi:hypothetical protein
MNYSVFTKQEVSLNTSKQNLKKNFKLNFQFRIKHPLLISSFSFLSACGIKSEVVSENLTTSMPGESFEQLKVDVNKYSSHKLVCDPFNENEPTTTTTYEQGIKAQLFYREDNMPRMFKALDYINFTRKSEKDIFLTDVNVPTRMFTEGFSTPNGDVLKKDSGEKLIEYFGLKMSTHLVLSDTDEEGFYELAVLADDGSNLIIKSGDGDNADETLIENDGDHPTRMGCATRTIHLRKNALLPIEMHYYQGPKYHISNVLMWRKSTTAGQDPSCGLLGNNMYFNPDHNSDQQTAYTDLLARGWKVVRPENFKISKTSNDYNPCVKGTAPIISDFAVNGVEGNSVQLSFITDIPSTAQIQFTNMSTGTVTTTTSDNLLRTTHILDISNLQSGTAYKLKAVAVSADLGRTLSAEIEIVIP